MGKTLAIIIALTFVCMNMVYAQGKDYHCLFTNNALIIDGKANEKIWEKAVSVDFVAHENEPLKAKSWFKASWDNDYLYFFFWLQDKDITGKMTQRDDHLWHEEVMEIFLDVDCNPKTYYEFEWNPLNTLLDLYVLNPNCTRDVIRQWWSWDCEGIKSAVQVKGTLNNAEDIDEGWSLEVAIPLTELQSAKNIPPKANDTWRFDVTRREGTEKQGTLQKSSWLPPSTHFPLSYGNLIFKK
jgi:hypothetical protein